MGWNEGYRIFEQTVIDAYDLGKLDKELLSVLMEPYRGTDIDSGGSRDLLSKDGKDVRLIVIETFGGKMPETPWYGANDEEWEVFFSSLSDEFNKITDGHFGWQ